VTRLYVIGILILLGAILANIIASKLNLKSWYDIFLGVSESSNYWSRIRIIDGIWLILIYPLYLGFSAYIGNTIYQKLF
tara:strand:- start:105 stop:341 length:237 start_codon:yes stop_codon:yes gene_type:complete